MKVDEAIHEITRGGLLTERQAEAFVLREIEATPRQATADEMGISVNTLDNTLSTARKKVRQAEATVKAVEEARHEELPSTCGNCGDQLGGSWTVIDDDPHCLDCAGIDPAEI